MNKKNPPKTDLKNNNTAQILNKKVTQDMKEKNKNCETNNSRNVKKKY